MNLRQIIIALAVITFLASSASGGFVFYTMKHSASHVSEQLVISHAETIQHRIGFLFSEYERSVSSLAGLPDIGRLLTSSTGGEYEAVNQLLDTFKTATGVSVCYVMDTDGLTIAASNRHSKGSFKGKNYSFRPYFQQAMNGQTGVYMAIGVTSGKRGLYFSHPVYTQHPGDPVGVVVIKAPITQLQREIKYSHFNSKAKLCLTAPSGLVFLSDDPELEGRFLWDVSEAVMENLGQSKQFGKGPWPKSGLQRVSETRALSPKGETLWLHTETVPRAPGWQIVHLSDSSEILPRMENSLFGLGGFLVILLSIGFGVCTLLLFNKARVNIQVRNRLEESLSRQSQYMKSLHEISLGLINHLEIDEILSFTLAGAARIFDTAHAFIYLLEPDQSCMRLRMGYGGIFDRLAGNTIQLNEGVAGKVWETKEPMVIENYNTWPQRVSHPALDNFNTIIGVPIYSQNRILGVLGLGLQNPLPPFSEERIEALVRFGEMVFIALENASLFAQEKQLLLQQKENEKNLRLSAQKLEKSETRFRSVIEKNADAIMVVDRKGIICFSNSAAEKFFNHGGESMVGSPFGLPITSGEGTEIEVLNAKGETAVAEMRLVETEWEGKIVYFASLRDITERKESEKERGKLEVQLQQSQRMEAIGTLAGGIAHDFNNILSAVIGFSELSLDMVKKGDPLENNIKEILNAGNRAKGLVRQILAFSRQTEQESIPLQIKSLAKEVLKLLRASLPSTIEIRQYLFSEGEVLADPTQIHQILMNLCTNAGHAMDSDGGVLTVSLEGVEPGDPVYAAHPEMASRPHQRLKIADTGPGIDPGIIDRIFDPFFTTKELGVGTGMGLSVVHGIIKNHNGIITAESTPGNGAVFCVYFPLIQEIPEIPSKERRTLPRGTERILMVDDELPIIRLGKQTLERLGYEVEIVQESTQALALFVSDPGRFDLLITDMTMPEMTGVQLAKHILGIRPGFPIILSTGFSGSISTEEVDNLGIRAMVMKPILKEEIALTIRKVLDVKPGLRKTPPEKGNETHENINC